jgi:hypothetical protein
LSPIPKEIYELKGKIRKLEESFLQLERRMESEFRMRYEAKAGPEGTTDDETVGLSKGGAQ